MSNTVFIKRGTKVAGPVEWSRVLAMAKERKLRRGDQLAAAPNGPWEDAQTVLVRCRKAAETATPTPQLDEIAQVMAPVPGPSEDSPPRAAAASKNGHRLRVAGAAVILISASLGWRAISNGQQTEAVQALDATDSGGLSVFGDVASSGGLDEVNLTGEGALEPQASHEHMDSSSQPPTLSATAQAAEPTTAGEMYILGRKYYDATEVVKDDRLAFYWVKRAADAGSPEAMCDVAAFYKVGIGAEINFDEWRRWLKASADAGDSYGMYWYAVAVGDGEILATELNAYWGWMNKARAKGNPLAKQAYDDYFQRSFAAAFESLEADADESVHRRQEHIEWMNDPANRRSDSP